MEKEIVDIVCGVGTRHIEGKECSIGMCIGICIGVCIGMCIDMCIGMCMAIIM